MESRDFNIIVSTILLMAIIAVTAAIFLIRPARSASSCMTYAEARKAWPTQHLWWHGSEHCWDNNSGKRHASRHRTKVVNDANGNRAMKIYAQNEYNPIDAAAPPTSEIAYPPLMAGSGTDVQMIDTRSVMLWPQLMDIDATPVFEPWRKRVAGVFEK